MARLPSASVIARWDDGHETEIGTIEMDSDRKGTTVRTSVRFLRVRLGWELILLGIGIMLPGRKWAERDE